MPVHDVDVTMPRRELGPTDVIFDVKVDEVSLGELRVSKGAVVWLPARKKYAHKLDWSRFAQLMESNAPLAETR